MNIYTKLGFVLAIVFYSPVTFTGTCVMDLLHYENSDCTGNMVYMNTETTSQPDQTACTAYCATKQPCQYGAGVYCPGGSAVWTR